MAAFGVNGQTKGLVQLSSLGILFIDDERDFASVEDVCGRKSLRVWRVVLKTVPGDVFDYVVCWIPEEQGVGVPASEVAHVIGIRRVGLARWPFDERRALELPRPSCHEFVVRDVEGEVIERATFRCSRQDKCDLGQTSLNGERLLGLRLYYQPQLPVIEILHLVQRHSGV